MKVIDSFVAKLRSSNHITLAAFVAEWKTGATFITLLLVAVLFWKDPSAIVALGKTFLALLGLFTWVVNAYYTKKNWALR